LINKLGAATGEAAPADRYPGMRDDGEALNTAAKPTKDGFLGLHSFIFDRLDELERLIRADPSVECNDALRAPAYCFFA
jgi:hypothetical protein